MVVRRLKFGLIEKDKNSLYYKLKVLSESDVKKDIDLRLNDFEALGKKGDKDWFCELCFCILTANSKASTALSIQQELGANGFICNEKDNICDCIKRNKHRFHNNKTKYIIEAREHKRIKKIITGIIKEKDIFSAREWIVNNIKGLGYKEASHFLRNVGYQELAILDRHVLNLMVENKILKNKPRSLSKKIYMEIEKKLKKLANSIGMTQAELDMYLWYMKTGIVLK